MRIIKALTSASIKLCIIAKHLIIAQYYKMR